MRELRRGEKRSRTMRARVAAVKALGADCAGPEEVWKATGDHLAVPPATFTEGLPLMGYERLFLGLLLAVLKQRWRGMRISAAELARRLGCCERTVVYVVKRLKVLGLVNVTADYVEVEPYQGKGGKWYRRRQVRNLYTLGEAGRARFRRMRGLESADGDPGASSGRGAVVPFSVGAALGPSLGPQGLQSNSKRGRFIRPDRPPTEAEGGAPFVRSVRAPDGALTKGRAPTRADAEPADGSAELIAWARAMATRVREGGA